MSTSSTKPSIGGAARIAEKIGTEIVAGRYPADSPVPGEIELGRRYGASRTVVREALKVLSAKGLIATRKRAGTRTRPREDWSMLDADVLAWRLRDRHTEPKFVADLLHVRSVVEPAAAAMAARRHTRKSLAPIEAAFAEMERTAHDPAAFADPDRRFHKAILLATGNDVMVAFAALTEAALTAFVRIASRHAGAPGPSVPLHRDVLDAIRRRDEEAARLAMTALLERTARNVARNVQRRARKPGVCKTAGRSPGGKQR